MSTSIWSKAARTANMSSASERCSRAAGSNATINTVPGRSAEATASSRSRPVNLTPVTLSTSMVITSVICLTVPMPTSGATVRLRRCDGAGHQESRRDADSDNGQDSEQQSHQACHEVLTPRRLPNPTFPLGDVRTHSYPLGMTTGARAETAIAVMRPRASRDRRGVARDRARRRGAQRRRRRTVAQNRQTNHRPVGASAPLEHAVLGAVRRRRRRRGDARTDRRQRCPRCAPPQHGSRSSSANAAGLRITTGNAQELYFPVCFELAVTRGAPSDAGSRRGDDGAAGHSRRPRPHRHRGAQPVRERPAGRRETLRAARHSWRDVRAGTEITGPFLAGLTTVLGPAESHRDSVGPSAGLVGADRRCRRRTTSGANAHDATTSLPWSIVDLGLSSVEPQQPPTVVGGSAGDRPLNRCVVDRVRATLRRALDRDELPDVPLLCAEEVDRSCAPWGLLAEDNQATLIAGIEIAVDLAPLTDVVPATTWRARSRRGCAKRPT